MRQEQFNEIINRLQTDPYFGITVLNLSNGSAIVKNKGKEALIDEYGSVENFFNQIFSNGITDIGIRTKRKNGHQKNGTYQTWKDGKEDILVFKLNPTEAPSQTPVQPFVANAPVQYSVPSLGNPGLSLPEMISLHVDRNDKTRLETENRFLKDENERLKKDNFDYKERELASKYSSDKSDKNTELILGLVQHADKLKGIFAPAQTASQIIEPALGNPNHSVAKQQLIAAISQEDDFTINILTNLFNAVIAETTMTAEVSELLKKHNIIE